MWKMEGSELELKEVHRMLMTDKVPLMPSLLHAFQARLRSCANCRLTPCHEQVAGYKCPKSWNKARSRKKERLQKFVATKAFRDFQEVFSSFVQEVVVPCVGDREGVMYQFPPTFRVQVPSDKPVGIPHKDADYPSHVDTEINFWVPVTKVWGANSLHTESAPGLGDFHPFELEFGQFVRFWGNQCHHYTVMLRNLPMRVEVGRKRVAIRKDER
ncbi:hypothetical protein GUITHDRAFT_137708 [Guillardia theta CCMP2712]|uniref:Uncharacterized protein n=1 Tax=Guillardia theta (strain CCMP2712) TaxID=905079 RepID=L1JF23_GUITC|nr:hypothetical protein GUITHDRAFT_137708 [Guillardia theta CCMP2712]EKX47101.1 hypothetical protein GUITHDRAFT_137708 [Guillardia theta CCMP2712]|eukprot:XP_005834081.1 hypothetical protein GUITHDRAFT_137708 [Guillardia theta CCMP2712]